MRDRGRGRRSRRGVRAQRSAAGGGADPTKASNTERYARDRQQCQAQVGETVRTRRTIDDSRRDVLSDPTDRFGRSELPDTIAAYGDASLLPCST